MASDPSVVDAKQYMDRAVQTDTPASTPRTSSEPSTSFIVQAPSDKLSDMDISSSSILLTSLSQSGSLIAAEDSAYSHEDAPVSSSPAPTIKTTTRTMRKVDISGGRPSQSFKCASNRVVSLPETVSAYSAKRALEKTPRVVSNPERFKISMMSPTESSFSDQLSLDPFENQRPERVRVRSSATDIPHTPSPPSSPDSVEIIANHSRLPDGFLRAKARTQESPSVQPDDDGWISWAKSPPRPIPALHGPLSLPYARCPSGAEGTVIEEQDELPRVIWGLEGDEPSHRPRSDLVHTMGEAQTHSPSQVPANVPTPVSAGTTAHKAARQQTSVPPRFHDQKSRENATHVLGMPQVQQESRVLSRPLPPLRHTPKLDIPSYEYAVPERGPIDLTDILHFRSNATHHKSYLREPDLSNNLAYGPLGNQHRGYHPQDQIDLDWQSLALTQERLKRLSLSSSNLSTDSHGGSMRPSSSSTSLSSARSPIILDPPSHLSQMPWSVASQQAQTPSSTPRRLSALEIAHNYRQQQVLQDHHKHQAMLPTPPSSSSPLWSSRFSPYQESLLSPEILAAARLTNAHAHKNSSVGQRQQSPLHRAELQHQARLAEYEHLHNLGLIGRSQMDQAYLSSGRTQEISQYHDIVYSSSGIDLSMLAASNRLQQPSSRSAPPQNLGTLQRSPAPPPRPPPNTPSTANFHETKCHQLQSKALASVTPPSPTSPMHRQNVSQQPRSIPLSRLIQRRLSAVPEEDSVLSSDHTSSPPPEARPGQFAYHSTPATQGAHKNTEQKVERGRSPDLVMHVQTVGTATSPGPDSGAVSSATSAKLSRSRDAKVMKSDRATEEGSLKRSDSKEVNSARGGRGRGRGGRGRRGRVALGNVVNGPERANGTMTVHS